MHGSIDRSIEHFVSPVASLILAATPVAARTLTSRRWMETPVPSKIWRRVARQPCARAASGKGRRPGGMRRRPGRGGFRGLAGVGARWEAGEETTVPVAEQVRLGGARRTEIDLARAKGLGMTRPLLDMDRLRRVATTPTHASSTRFEFRSS
jgi:hypothetical protein